jgi:hypothetical protein
LKQAKLEANQTNLTGFLFRVFLGAWRLLRERGLLDVRRDRRDGSRNDRRQRDGIRRDELRGRSRSSGGNGNGRDLGDDLE